MTRRTPALLEQQQHLDAINLELETANDFIREYKADIIDCRNALSISRQYARDKEEACAHAEREHGRLLAANTALQSKLTTLLEAAEARLENDLPDTRTVDQHGRPLGSCAASIIRLRAAVKKAREGL